MNNLKNEILADIKKAKKSIKIAVAWLTDDDLLGALLDKKDITIEIVVSNAIDNKDNHIKNLMSSLIKLGAKIRTYGSDSPLKGNFLHCKFYIIDEEFCKSGSYNWSKSAEKNIECLDTVELLPKIQMFQKLINNGSTYMIIKN